MEQTSLDTTEESTKFDQISKFDLVAKYEALEEEYYRALREIYRLKYQHLNEVQLSLVVA